ncbi:MAG: fumarylacetoacetate hydrolase family protein [Bacteroidota bacterium]
MRLVRILHDGSPRYARAEGDTLFILDGEDLMSLRLSGARIPAAGARFLAPAAPSKVVAVGLNYRDHAREMGEDLPAEPKLFLKPSTSVIGPGEAIVLPPESRRVDYEAELALIVGRRARRIPPAEAENYILGYTCLNDVTARDLQAKDGQWTRAKSFDTFCPLGPAIETKLDPRALRLEARVNGAVRQASSTANLIFSAQEIFSFVSHVMTLLPGDVIATGTPPGVGPLAPGDLVEVEIEGIGTLVNPVVN